MLSAETQNAREPNIRGCAMEQTAAKWRTSLLLTLLPAMVILRRLSATEGGSIMTPRHISRSRAYSDKIPTATPLFSESRFLVVVLPISWDVGVR